MFCFNNNGCGNNCPDANPGCGPVDRRVYTCNPDRQVIRHQHVVKHRHDIVNEYDVIHEHDYYYSDVVRNREVVKNHDYTPYQPSYCGGCGCEGGGTGGGSGIMPLDCGCD